MFGTWPELFKTNYLMPDMVYIHVNIMGLVPNYVSTHCFTAFGIETSCYEERIYNFY